MARVGRAGFDQLQERLLYLRNAESLSVFDGRRKE